METENKKSYSWIWWLIGLIAACTLTGFMVHNNGPKIDEFFGHKYPVESQEVVEDTTVYDVPTIQEVLEFRRQAQELKRADSLFLTIPDVVLIDILSNHGTELSSYDIMCIYEGNPKIYNAVQSGARAQLFKESLPDSLSKQPQPDVPSSGVD